MVFRIPPFWVSCDRYCVEVVDYCVWGVRIQYFAYDAGQLGCAERFFRSCRHSAVRTSYADTVTWRVRSIVDTILYNKILSIIDLHDSDIVQTHFGERYAYHKLHMLPDCIVFVSTRGSSPSDWVEHIVIQRQYEITSVSCAEAPERDLHATWIIRELVVRLLEQAGGFLLHAGAVCLAGKGLIICGPKGSGKTSTVINLLASGKATLVAEERILLKWHKEKWFALGIPRDMRIGIGSLPHLPGQLRKFIDTPKSTVVDPLEVWGNTQKIKVGIEIVTEAFNTQLLLGPVQVDMVLFPRLRDKDNVIELVECSFEDAEQILNGELSSPEDPLFGQGWLELGTNYFSHADYSQMCSRMVRQVTYRRLLGGKFFLRDFYESNVLSDILALTED